MKLVSLILSFSVISISTATTSNLRREYVNKHDHKKSPSSKPVTAPKRPTSAPFKAITIKDALPKYASVVNGKLTYNFKVMLNLFKPTFYKAA